MSLSVKDYAVNSSIAACKSLIFWAAASLDSALTPNIEFNLRFQYQMDVRQSSFHQPKIYFKVH